MNANANIAPVITADNDALTRDFPLKPFGIRHKLSGHPLLSLTRIAKLAADMPRDLIEYNSGNAQISQDPDKVKSVDLDPVEVVKRIESAGAWMVLKRIEKDPEYRALLEDALTSVARARGFNSVEDAGFSQIEGFLFVSSPNSTTPFHMDAEDNFFVQIYGDKTFAVFDNRDGGIANDEQVEYSTTKHRNVPYNDGFMPRGTVFKLVGGDGCYIPYQWPHWVKTAGTYSISMAITWKTEDVKRMNDLHFCNSFLRSLGAPQAAPGKNASLDAVKLAVWRSARAVVEPLRSSETMRRIIRRIALGKNANYYLKKA